jgi:fermentation-respiration switch protein FrsA (DUF1100 family)
VLILHGDRDEVISFAFGRELFEHAKQPKEFWEVRGALHNDLVEVAGTEYSERLRALYRRIP